MRPHRHKWAAIQSAQINPEVKMKDLWMKSSSDLPLPEISSRYSSTADNFAQTQESKRLEDVDLNSEVGRTFYPSLMSSGDISDGYESSPDLLQKRRPSIHAKLKKEKIAQNYLHFAHIPKCEM